MTRDEWLAKREAIKEGMKALGRWAESGCGDGNCKIRKPTGMHTNGGCKCYRGIADDALRLAELADSIQHIHSIQ